MHTHRIPRLAAVAVALGLGAGCGERAVVTPPPLGQPSAAAPQLPGSGPDTRAMGAGPAGASCAARSEEVLHYVNAARATARQCGRRPMAAAAPLRWDQALYAAASTHSLDMARRNYFDHRSPEGLNVSERVSASRYRWKSVGENLAGGSRSAVEAVQGWLDSPEHCENLMDPRFVDVAVACVQQPGSEWGIYWTMVLGRR